MKNKNNLLSVFITLFLILNLGCFLDHPFGWQIMNGIMAIALFHSLFRKEIKNHYHDFWIRVLTSKGGLRKENINFSKKEVDLGFYRLHAMFFDAKHDLACAMLKRYHGYRFYKEVYHFSLDVPKKKKKERDHYFESEIHLN